MFLRQACGLEILASRAGSQPDAADSDPTLDELRDDVRWQRYLTSLNQKRYFGVSGGLALPGGVLRQRTGLISLTSAWRAYVEEKRFLFLAEQVIKVEESDPGLSGLVK